MLKSFRFVAFANVAIAVAAGIAQAAPVTTEYPGVTGDIVLPVSTTDFFQTHLSSVSITAGSADLEGTANPAVLANGIGNTANPQLFTPNTGAQVTFVLDTSVNTSGYPVTRINTYGGWNDSGRDRQNFTITYATAAAPTTFLPVDSIAFDPINADGGESASSAFFLVPLLNVAAVRFTFDAQENGHAGYTEFDLIPEPSSLVLLGLGAVGMIIARRRRG